MTESALFVGGRVFTGRRYCSALLIEDGEVLFAGSESEARRAAPAGVDVRPLSGGLVLPGLIDSHIHVAAVTRWREGLNLRDLASTDLLLDGIRRWAEAHPSGPIVGQGLDPERFPGGTWPTRHDLDRVVPDRPVVVGHVSGHALIVNSTLLGAAGIDRTVPDPPGGRFGREPDGNPDGRVFEGAISYLEGRLPELETVEPAALARTLGIAASLGLTTLGAMSVDPEEAVALRELAESGELPGRLRVYLRASSWHQYLRSPGGPSGPPGRFEVVGIKAYTDGAFGTRTAWLSAPYADDPENSGMPVATDEPLRSTLGEAARRGLAPALHAIGDRAIRYALDVLDDHPAPPGRVARIEHAALTPPDLFPKLAHIRPALVVQPGFVWSDSWLGARLGAGRVRWAYAFRTLLHQGHLLAGSSDAPYDPVDPWRGLRAAVERTDPEGRTANAAPEEALGPEEAVQLYTTNAGRAFGEPTLGLLEPGSPADLIWVAAPSLAVGISAGSSAVRETWVAGRRVVGVPDAVAAPTR